MTSTAIVTALAMAGGILILGLSPGLEQQTTPQESTSHVLEEKTMTQDAPTPGSLVVATATITVDKDPIRNLEHMREVLENTLRDRPDVRLLLFGETVLGWFHMPGGETQSYQDSIAQTVPGPATEFIGQLAQRHGVYISFGLSERKDGELFNTQVLMGPDGELEAVHRKFCIRNPAFTAAEETLTTAQVDGATVALLICADARSRSLVRAIRRGDVDIVLAGLVDHETKTLISRMIGAMFGTWAFTANRYGEEGSVMWNGLTTITDSWARLKQSSVGQECVLVQEVPLHDEARAAAFVRRSICSIKALGFIAGILVQMAMGK